MAAYFTEKISTGAVASLTCPTAACEVQALPNQVAELVVAGLYAKYEQLLLETQLESMADVVSCPRVDCQCPTMIDRETNLGQCPACSFAFCIYCKVSSLPGPGDRSAGHLPRSVAMQVQDKGAAEYPGPVRRGGSGGAPVPREEVGGRVGGWRARRPGTARGS
jgi:hypothetical protein